MSMLSPQGGSDATLREFFEAIYLPQSGDLQSSRSIDEFHTQINNFQKYFRWRCSERNERLREATLADLTDETLSGAMRWQLERSPTKSRATANKLFSHIRALWAKAYKRHLLDTLPRVEKFSEPKREHRTWTREEFSAVVAAAAKTDYFVGEIPAPTWWTALLWCLANTGSRISAMLKLKSENVDFQRNGCGVLLLPAKDTKEDADRTYDLAAVTREALAALKPDDRELVFDWPWDTGPTHHLTTLLRHYRKRILKPAKIAEPKGSKPFHTYRAMVATWIADEDGEEAAKEFLGHSHVSVTRRYFDRTQIGAQRRRPNHLLKLFDPPEAEAS